MLHMPSSNEAACQHSDHRKQCNILWFGGQMASSKPFFVLRAIWLTPRFLRVWDGKLRTRFHQKPQSWGRFIYTKPVLLVAAGSNVVTFSCPWGVGQLKLTCISISSSLHSGWGLKTTGSSLFSNSGFSWICRPGGFSANFWLKSDPSRMKLSVMPTSSGPS